MHIILRSKDIEDKIPDINNLDTKAPLDAKWNEIKGETPIITNLATKTALKINEVKDKIPNIFKLATTNVLTAVENKTPSVSNLVEKLIITQKLLKLKRKLLIVIMINISLLQNLIISLNLICRIFLFKIKTSKLSKQEWYC